MPSFEENLNALTQSTDTIAALELYGDGYEPAAVIENKPGSSGSVAVYYEVAVEFDIPAPIEAGMQNTPRIGKPSRTGVAM